MNVYLATDHAGFETKNALVAFLKSKGYDAIDCGPFAYDKDDDYPELIAIAARKLQEDVRQGIDSRAIVMGASGQGEAMVANRFRGVRCALYYGAPQTSQTDAAGKQLNMIQSVREHNNANCLSLGARFLSQEDIEQVVLEWLSIDFPREERHARRIDQIDIVS
jgi:ribose 5-phosphate isomerase B